MISYYGSEFIERCFPADTVLNSKWHWFYTHYILIKLTHDLPLVSIVLFPGMEYGEIVIHTHKSKTVDTQNHKQVDLSALELRPTEGVVVKLF